MHAYTLMLTCPFLRGVVLSILLYTTTQMANTPGFLMDNDYVNDVFLSCIFPRLIDSTAIDLNRAQPLILFEKY